jgi:group I intron endonuclease
MTDPQFTVYTVTNTINGRQYVGLTSLTLHKRWMAHKAKASGPTVPVTSLHLDIRRLGADQFTIEAVETFTVESKAVQAEASAIDSLSNGYNTQRGGYRGLLREETKQKIRKAHLGRKRSASWRASHAKASTGKAMHPNARAALLASHVGVPLKPEVKAKLSAAFTGRPQHPNQVAALKRYHTDLKSGKRSRPKTGGAA